MVDNYCDQGVPSARLDAATSLGIFHYYYKIFCAVIGIYGTKSEPEMTGLDTSGWAVSSNQIISNQKALQGNS